MIDFDIVSEVNCQYNLDLIKKAVTVFSENHRQAQGKFFTLVFTSGRNIKKLNSVYRGKNKVTDVLSFAVSDSPEPFPDDENDLGEIVVCWPEVKRQAKEYDWKIDYEVIRLLIHGLAHLVGYDHENVSQKKAQAMEKFESKVIGLVFKN
jgi:rRNA maturation RNase YbeY